MKRAISAILILTMLVSLAAASATGAPGGAGDPVVTLSYVNNILIPQVSSGINAAVSSRFGAAYNTRAAELEQYAALYKQSLTTAKIYDAVAAAIYDRMASGYHRMSLNKDQVITGSVGTSVIFLAGGGTVYGTAGNTVIDINAGKEIAVGAAVSPNIRYMLTGDGQSGIRVSSAAATVLVDGLCSLYEVYGAKYTDLADALYQMGLFKGTTKGYELDRSATRLEALIMLVRMLGEEQAALAYTGTHPFADVPKWADDQADKIVAYAYHMGYTNGTSATKFSANAQATPEQYMTFLLRALGYSDANDGSGDFIWSQSITKAKSVGLLRTGEAAELSKVFYRDQAVYTSYYALQTPMKGREETLLEFLIVTGAVDGNKADTAITAVTRVRPAA